MGHKVNPKVLRLGITTSWRSCWFGGEKYAELLKQDVEIRRAILKKWKGCGISDIEIERNSGKFYLRIKTSRPGVIIGRGGDGISKIESFVKSSFFPFKKIDLTIDVQEIKQFEENASLVAQNVAEQIEKRVPFRRVLKSMLEQVEKNKNVKGIKIQMSGRLNGAEMSRTEWLSKGAIPLHTLRADIDFARDTARTIYGAIGVKVWIYKGEIFSK